MSTLTEKLAEVARNWKRMRMQAQIAHFDNEIESIRQMRAFDHECELAMKEERARLARCLQVMKQEDINRVTAANVRAMAQK
jgi:hypothetical protein